LLGFDFTLLQTQLLAMVLGAVIIAILLSSTWLTNRFKQNVLIMLIYVIPSFIGTIILMTVENTSLSTKVGLLISYYIVLSFWAAQTLGMSLLSRNIGGQTKKTVCVTLNFVSWCTGNAIGKSCCCFVISADSARPPGVLVQRCTSLPDRFLGPSWLLWTACDCPLIPSMAPQKREQEERSYC
jgi:hypothetical protein